MIIAWAISSLLLFPHAITSTVSQRALAAGTFHRREFFYIGAKYADVNGSQIAHGQMCGCLYCLSDCIYTTYSLHPSLQGHGMTGTNFLHTPDGRMGWADYFMSKGYEVYLADQPTRARSPHTPGLDGIQENFLVINVERWFTRPEHYRLWPQAVLHSKWPGNGCHGDPIFDAFYAATVPSLTSAEEASVNIRYAGSLLLDEIGPVILVTHSESGPFGWILADARPDKVKMIVAAEPAGPPFIGAVFNQIKARPFGLTEVPLEFSPPIASAEDLHPVITETDPTVNYTCFQLPLSAPRKLVNLASKKVLLLTSESGFNRVFDNCTALFLERGGVDVTHVELQDVGIHGNGHMMLMEEGNLQIADVIERWIQSH